MDGLSNKQVKSKIAAGKVNKTVNNSTSNLSIIKKHLLTLFNVLIFILALIVFIFGDKRDALFIIVAALATTIAIINDLRAKHIVDKLNLVSTQAATVIRDGKEAKIAPEQIVEDDILKLSLGDQIIVDAKIINGTVEVNDSFITGESDNIQKSINDELISGSFIVSGTCLAKATAVGNNSFISKISKNAKKIKENRSKLFKTLNKIIKINSFILIPVGILLFLKQFSLSNNIETTVTSTVAALVAMIPEGLILLTSSVLALATIRLGKFHVLVQDFYSIETLARIDTICLDKTGTLTTGNLKVEKIVPVGKHSEPEIIQVIQNINSILGDSNSTSHALINKFGQNPKAKVDDFYHFSSDKKYSGIKIKNEKFLIGAFDFITEDKSFKSLENSLAENYRVLTVVKKGKNEEILGFVLLSDEIRKNAKPLLEFFDKNDVKVKIISGDNLSTIQKILETLHIDSKKSVDLSTKKSPDYQNLVENFDIFARVKPEQKQKLIAAMKQSGKTVAMTGDGVNDVLALKEADCGISLGAGADAARRVSDIILLDNDFSSLPTVIFEGRQTINNITRSSSLFLSKTIFATILSVVFIFLNFRYPFSPIEMSLINFVIIGAPSFLLALETNHSRVKSSFKSEIIKNSIPAALATIFVVISLAIISEKLAFSWQTTISFSCILTCLIGFLLIYKISRPLNKLRGLLLISLISIIILVFLTPLTRNFFAFTLLEQNQYLILIILGAISSLIFLVSSQTLSRRSS